MAERPEPAEKRFVHGPDWPGNDRFYPGPAVRRPGPGKSSRTQKKAKRPDPPTRVSSTNYDQRDWPGHAGIVGRHQKPDEPGGEPAGDREPRKPGPIGPLIGRAALELPMEEVHEEST